jgi:hypothetical protein
MVPKAVVEKDLEAVVIHRLFHQTMGPTPPDGPAKPASRQEAAETMVLLKGKD